MSVANYITYGCSYLRTTPGVISIQELHTGGKALLQLLLIIPYVSFQATNQFPINFTSTFRVMTYNSCDVSSWNIINFGQKERIKVQFFNLLSALMKVHPIPHAIFETATPGFIQILHHCSVSWKITPLRFCSSNLVYFVQKEPIKKKFLEFLVVGWK